MFAISSRPVAGALSALALAVACVSASAQEYPTKPIRIIMPYAPAGSPTLVGNLLVENMGPLLGQTMYLDHRTGAAGVPAVTGISGAPADGYTVGLLDSSHWAISPAMQPDIVYDVMRDLTPVGLVYVGYLTIAVRDSIPAKTLKEFVELAKRQPGTFKYGVVIGSLHHLAMETFKAETGADITMVPYKGAGEIIPAVLRDDIQVTLNALNGIRSHVEAGKIRILGVTSSSRGKELPDVPTVAEAAGLPGYRFVGDSALFARAGTPRPILDKLGAALLRAAALPDVVARAQKVGVEMTPAGPDRVLELIREDRKRYASAVRHVQSASTGR